jgi:signal transduction histidine kinase
MRDSLPGAAWRHVSRVFGWRRLLPAFLLSLLVWLPLSPGWKPTPFALFERTTFLAGIGLAVFGLFEVWPRRLPGGLARWVLQVLAVALAMPVGAFLSYVLSTPAGAPPFWTDPERFTGFGYITLLSVLVAPWGALGGLVFQKEALAQNQALAFALERSEFERRALDGRLRLLQAQVAPHFLFNTLANVQALVEAGSPRAPEVLRHLTAYLRAATPRLGDRSTTVGEELDLARAYLELMRMRMPDRLTYTIEADDASRAVRCPSTALLTLVENAVRHGIDPSEVGGTIEVVARRNGDRCLLRVRDTGVGLVPGAGGMGTGLATLRERLELGFGGDARLSIQAAAPAGVCADLDLPANGDEAR